MAIWHDHGMVLSMCILSLLGDAKLVHLGKHITKNGSGHRSIRSCGEHDRNFVVLLVEQHKTWMPLADAIILQVVIRNHSLGKYTNTHRPNR